ncbi:MAG: hypothetical protein LPK02_06920 [Rhodobacterales bacterium]|nr:hypothetical protein [Rhodobacterales bacterium]
MPNEIADIIPRAAEADDRLLVRSGVSAPFGLEALSNLTPAQLVAIRNEIIAARGSRSQLADRIATISNFVSPNAGGFIVGQYYDNSFHGTASGTSSPGAGNIHLAPFYTSQPITVDRIGINITSAAAGTVAQLAIYEANNETNWPETLVWEGSGTLPAAANGFQEYTTSFTFDAGRQYWLGLRVAGGNSGFRGVALASCVNLGLNSATNAQFTTILTLAAASFPSPWVFAPTQRGNNAVAPSIRFRIAA